jgi:RNA polymerase sigma-70 factor (ECF subfamily)
MTAYGLQSDMILLDRYRWQRDEQAFAQIVERYAKIAYGAALRVLGDSARAEEIVQETFFRLLQKPDQVKRSLVGWLHRVATQLAIDTVRADAARQRRERTHGDTEQRRIEDIEHWAQLSPLIDEALADLPDEPRTLLVRHFLLGRSQQQLAGDYRVSAATISRRIAAATEQLRGTLRRKGVVAGAAVVAVCFRNNVAQAAPASLTAQLAKMTMVSGASAGAATAAKIGVAAIAVVMVSSLAAICVIAFVASLRTATAPRPTAAGGGSQTIAPASELELPADPQFATILINPQTRNVDSRAVAGFRPPREGDREVIVVFGDSHTSVMPLAAADTLMRDRVGLSLTELIRRAKAHNADQSVGAVTTP